MGVFFIVALVLFTIHIEFERYLHFQTHTYPISIFELDDKIAD